MRSNTKHLNYALGIFIWEVEGTKKSHIAFYGKQDVYYISKMYWGGTNYHMMHPINYYIKPFMITLIGPLNGNVEYYGTHTALGILT